MACDISNLNILIDEGDTLNISFPNETFSNTTIFQLKKQISLETSYEIENQTLLYNHTVLENIHTFIEYGVTADSFLLLITKDSSYLFVINGTSKVITFTFPNFIFSQLTVSKLKSEIKNRENIHEKLQHLCFNGNVLEGDRTIGEYGIETNSTLTLVTDFVECIFIKTFTGKTITITLTNKIISQTTVMELKTLIKRNELIPTHKQCLILSGKELRNEFTLGKYGIKTNYVLHLIVLDPIQTQACCLFVNTSNGDKIEIVIPIKTFPRTTVRELMSKIEHKQGIPFHSQSLYFAGKKLEINNFLSHYNIINKSVVDLQLNICNKGNYSNHTVPLEFSEIPFEERLDQIDVTLFAPHWRVVREGVNFRGCCYNSNCFANNKIVYVQKGFYISTEGVCVLNNEISHLECPICSHNLDKKSIHGVGIYKCKLEVRVKKKGKNKLIYRTDSKDSFKFATYNEAINDCIITVKPI